MAISTIDQTGLNAPLTLNSPVISTITNGAATLTLPTTTGTILAKNSSGYFTNPNQPAFAASLNGSNQTITSGSNVVLTYGNAITNQSNSYNASTYTFTAPVAGFYFLSARVRLDGITGGGNYGLLGLQTTNQTFTSIYSSSASYSELSIQTCIYMTQGNTAYVYGNSNGQTLTVINSQPNYSDFSGFLIC